MQETTTKITIRVNRDLAQALATTRLSIELPSPATVDDLLAYLSQTYPQASQRLTHAVAVSAGKHLAPSDELTSGQEVALLMPIAGGKMKG